MSDYFTARDLMDEGYEAELDALLRRRPKGINAARARFDEDYEGVAEDF